jgi:hypothetical protein
MTIDPGSTHAGLGGSAIRLADVTASRVPAAMVPRMRRISGEGWI